MHFRSLLTVLLTGFVYAASADTVDPYRGKLLYENHCLYCHYRNVHFRPRRKVRSLDELQRQICNWQEEMELDWRRRDVADVLSYLNWLYYGFSYFGRIPGS